MCAFKQPAQYHLHSMCGQEAYLRATRKNMYAPLCRLSSSSTACRALLGSVSSLGTPSGHRRASVVPRISTVSWPATVVHIDAGAHTRGMLPIRRMYAALCCFSSSSTACEDLLGTASSLGTLSGYCSASILPRMSIILCRARLA